VTQTTPSTVSRLRVGLGTFVAVEAASRDPKTAARGIEAAFEAVRTIERVMHPELAGSDLPRLASGGPGAPLAVHPWTWAVLELCGEIHAASRGIFDPCLPGSPGRLRDLELLPDARVRPRARVLLDLGGIAKGFAVDRALEALASAGCESGLVNAGGDLAVFGPREHHIVCRGSASPLMLRDAALASSAVGEASRPSGHRGHYHGVSGMFASRGRVSIIAPSAALADALTKCLLWCEGTPAEELLRRFGARRVAG
jgi:thiamine biosynthesis lipoprotein